MMQIKPSFHAIEVFYPIMDNESMLLDIIKTIPSIRFYRGIENGVFFSGKNRKELYKIVKDNDYQLTSWLSPYVLEDGLSPSSLNSVNRKVAINKIKELTALAAESGTTHCGIPCGPFLGEKTKSEQIKALFDSYCQIYDWTRQFSEVDYTFEPLDRYAHKKMLLGPMDETVDFIGSLRKECPKFYIHWDSAHETLSGIDLGKSLALASKHLAQIHLCNCVATPTHPYYGDWHMDVGSAPSYRNWGFLTIPVATKILKQVASLAKPEGIRDFYCAVEVRSQKGNDLWAKEAVVRDFLQRAFDEAGLQYDK